MAFCAWRFAVPLGFGRFLPRTLCQARPPTTEMAFYAWRFAVPLGFGSFLQRTLCQARPPKITVSWVSAAIRALRPRRGHFGWPCLLKCPQQETFPGPRHGELPAGHFGWPCLLKCP